MATSFAQPASSSQLRRREALEGVLLGMAVGDALGLPYEGLTGRRARKLFGSAGLRHRFLFGRGMISDDTEHAAMTAQALLAAGENVSKFRRSLAWRFRFWLLGIPAGVGLGTLRAIIKLWLGFPPTHSGVNSAGNGPAMRAPIIGAVFADDPPLLREIIIASTHMTHSDSRADQGALAIAIAAAAATRQGCTIPESDVLEQVQAAISDPELAALLAKVATHLDRRCMPEEMAAALGLRDRVSGYMYHTVPMALFCWLRFRGNYRESIEAAVRLGGDTDTVAAIVGALAGATTGPSAIPPPWLDGLIEWPRSVAWLRSLADRVARRFPGNDTAEFLPPKRLFWPGQLLRNILFAVVVLFHGFRRLLPPY